MKNDIKVSIVIPAKNEEVRIAKTINSMFDNTEYKNFEIIVVDDNSTDKTNKIVSSITKPNLKLLKTKGIGLPCTRNKGIKASKGDLVIVSDAHMTMCENWLEKILDIYQETNFDMLSIPMKADPEGVGSPDYVGYGQYLTKRFDLDWYLTSPEAFADIAIAPGGFCVYKSSIFDNLGLFDEGIYKWGFEDVEISIRAWLLGYRIQVAYNMHVYHYFKDMEKDGFVVFNNQMEFNKLRTAYLHFNKARFLKMREKAIENLATDPYYTDPEKEVDSIIKKVLDSNIKKYKKTLDAKKKYNDDWYFEKFASGSF